MSRKVDKETQAVIDYALSNGFFVARDRKHIVLKYADRTLTVSSTTSCRHAHKNAMKIIDRIVKEMA